MRVQMKATVYGSRDGGRTEKFEDGQPYDLGGSERELELAKVFIREGWAEVAAEEAERAQFKEREELEKEKAAREAPATPPGPAARPSDAPAPPSPPESPHQDDAPKKHKRR